jgi:cobalt-zinc-cadmium efflux system protein
LLRESLDLAMDAVPEGVDVVGVQDYFRNLPGIIGFHHLHIWPLSTTETALTVHLVKPQTEGDDDLLGTVNLELRARFRIDHATIQFERAAEERFGGSAGGCVGECSDAISRTGSP